MHNTFTVALVALSLTSSLHGCHLLYLPPRDIIYETHPVHSWSARHGLDEWGPISFDQFIHLVHPIRCALPHPTPCATSHFSTTSDKRSRRAHTSTTALGNQMEAPSASISISTTPATAVSAIFVPSLPQHHHLQSGTCPPHTP